MANGAIIWPTDTVFALDRRMKVCMKGSGKRETRSAACTRGQMARTTTVSGRTVTDTDVVKR